ncbi:MAG TPA: hypothetical protein VFZ51_07800 [Woeseiaceae bacterium]
MLGIAGQIITVGAHAVGLATHATPALQGEDFTEFYLTQPVLMAQLSQGPVEFNGMINFEGLTLERGELNAGVWGEGYADRRHPHTYLHEAALTLQGDVFRSRVSLTAGRGFAPFGSDDPMVRPFVKYPANHHLAQLLERLILIGALQHGPVTLEAGLFNGTEPVDPEDTGDFGAFGDSWSGRATLHPWHWLELQASYAEVTSPENQFGGGLDHEMWHASARVERAIGDVNAYLLVETGETSEGVNGFQVFFFHTALAEAALQRGRWQLALRLERSERPEEERETNLFRTVRPATDNSILGITRWTSAGLQLAAATRLGSFRLQPFVEVTRLHVQPLEEFPVLLPENLYGSDRMWSFSLGIRSVIGAWHTRMGRYGAARQAAQQHHH